jgi:hypothetical protein
MAEWSQGTLRLRESWGAGHDDAQVLAIARVIRQAFRSQDRSPVWSRSGDRAADQPPFPSRPHGSNARRRLTSHRSFLIAAAAAEPSNARV